MKNLTLLSLALEGMSSTANSLLTGDVRFAYEAVLYPPQAVGRVSTVVKTVFFVQP